MLNGIYKTADRIILFAQRIEKIRGKAMEAVSVILFTLLHFLMAFFHEPWFDEALAWQIARCADLKDILFTVPHYEGHPQLWHLILLPFARMGAPYEMTLTLVTFLFAGTAVVLIVYRSPFPRIVRCLLPFTYFIFYQYGVIARPYCVMLLAFVMLAVTYKTRNECPGRYVLSLVLLCATSAYGIVIAGGIALVWLMEIWDRKAIGKFLKSCIGDRRIGWLVFLFVIALFFVLSIMPAEDTFATNLAIKPEDRTPFWVRLFYMLFASLSDALLTDVYGGYQLLLTVDFPFSALLSAGVIGIVLCVAIWYYGNYKKTALVFFVPYVCVGIVASVLYMNAHHIGIVQFLFLFWLWISLEETEIKTNLPKWDSDFAKQSCRLVSIGGAVCIFVLIVWNVSACVQEMEKEYAIGRSLAQYIKDNNLDERKIMAEWLTVYEDEGHEVVLAIDTNHCPLPMDISPYFDRNIIYNFADGKEQGNYISHIVADEEENEKNYEKWRVYGKPDVLLMAPALNQVWPDREVTYKDYLLVFGQKTEQIWKMTSESTYTYLYVRQELAEELGLKAVIGSN